MTIQTNSTIVAGDITNILKALYPVGSIYIGTQSTCPLSTLIPGSSWSLVSQDRSLQGSSGSHAAGSTIEAGLPNITGNYGTNLQGGNGIFEIYNTGAADSALYATRGSHAYTSIGGTSNNTFNTLYLDASRSNPIYGNSSTVQPAAYVVNVWRRAS